MWMEIWKCGKPQYLTLETQPLVLSFWLYQERKPTATNLLMMPLTMVQYLRLFQKQSKDQISR